MRVARKQFEIKARLATGAERERLWEVGKSVNPMWAKYQTRTARELPVVVLTPTAEF